MKTAAQAANLFSGRNAGALPLLSTKDFLCILRVHLLRHITSTCLLNTIMVTHQIVAVRKPNRDSSYEHITHVQYDGRIWSREHVISLIDARSDSFFVRVGSNRSEVGVVRPDRPRLPFLRTYADGQWNDNLLSLPAC